MLCQPLPAQGTRRSSRPRHYRKAGRWLEVVRLYRSNGHSAREIADILNDALYVLQRLHEEERQVIVHIQGQMPGCIIEPELPRGHPLRLYLHGPEGIGPSVAILSREDASLLKQWWSNHLWWTPEQVSYHIRQQTSVGQMPPISFKHRQRQPLNEIRRFLRESEVARLGWDHLLPQVRLGGRQRSSEVRRILRRQMRESEWQGNCLDLTVSEARILSLILEHGPLTGSEIAMHLRHKRSVVSGQLLRRLLKAELMVVHGLRKSRRSGVPARVFALAAGLSTHVRTGKEDGIDKREKFLDALAAGMKAMASSGEDFPDQDDLSGPSWA